MRNCNKNQHIFAYYVFIRCKGWEHLLHHVNKLKRYIFSRDVRYHQKSKEKSEGDCTTNPEILVIRVEVVYDSKVVVDVISRFNWLSVGVLSFTGDSKGGGYFFLCLFFCRNDCCRDRHDNMGVLCVHCCLLCDVSFDVFCVCALC